jgi:hypothetical protein
MCVLSVFYFEVVTLSKIISHHWEVVIKFTLMCYFPGLVVIRKYGKRGPLEQYFSSVLIISSTIMQFAIHVC